MNHFLVFAFLFFIGSCAGWCIELLFRRFFSSSNPERKWINPGFLVGPYLPLYGFGLWGMFVVSCATMLILTGNRVVDTIMIFVIMALVMTIIEYLAGLIFIKGMKVKLWDYSRQRFNIQGVICLKFTIVWGLLGSLYYFTINTHVIGWVVWLSQHLTFSFFIGMFFGVFFVDLGYSLQLSAKIRAFAVENELVIKYEELKDFMRKRREEMEEKGRFLLAFQTEEPFRAQMERYVEESIEKSRKKFEEAGEAFRKIEREVKSKVKGENVENKDY